MHSANNSRDNFADRFIPLRTPKSWEYRFANKAVGLHSSTYSNLMENELFESLEQRTKRNLFTFNEKLKRIQNNHYSTYFISKHSQKLLNSKRVPERKPTPYTTLNADDLEDNFYLNLLDWSSTNTVALGIGLAVYLYNCKTCEVSTINKDACGGDLITSVSWSQNGNLLAVGSETGTLKIWDVNKNTCTSTFHHHSKRVGALAWQRNNVWSGSNDCSIVKTDTLSQSADTFRGHQQEVCSLKWSPDMQMLASGGNDNKLCVWTIHSKIPVQTYTKHRAAVKGLAWSQHHYGLLVSGGGCKDYTIRFWNILTEQPIPQVINTNSQVSNLAWAGDYTKLVSTHGFSSNEICIWNYPSLSLSARLKRHKGRVLYLSTSPDGESIVTGSGDGQICFWKLFDKKHKQICRSDLNLFTSIR